MQCKLVIDVEHGVLHVEAPQQLAVDLLAWAEKAVGLLSIMARETKRVPLVKVDQKGDVTSAAAVQ